jgi:hypothetical protein
MAGLLDIRVEQDYPERNDSAVRNLRVELEDALTRLEGIEL